MKLKKKLLLFTFVFALILGACSSKEDTPISTDQVYTGILEETMNTAFFDFTITSVEFKEEVAGYTAQEGNLLVDATIQIKNTFGTDIPMFATDFQISYYNDDDDFNNMDYYAFPLEAFDDSMAPVETTLADGESSEYHYIFEVPKGYRYFTIGYLEVYENEEEGNAFFISFEDENGEFQRNAFIGEPLQTFFFDFTVVSATTTDEYQGQTAAENHTFLDVVIHVENTFGDVLPMFDTDFQFQWYNTAEDLEKEENYGFVMNAWDESMIPTEYTLENGGSSDYHYVVEVPKGYQYYSVSFLEVYDDETVGQLFVVDFEAE